MGGMYRVIESLTSIAESLGVKFIYNAPAKQIEVGGDGAARDRATGVLLEDGRRLPADLIVANADLPYVYDKLLPDRAEAKRIDRMKFTSSAIMFYWGVDKVYPQLGAHNVFLAGEYKASFDAIFNDHSLPAEPSLYVHAPARVDPAAAPASQDTLMVLVPVGHLDGTKTQDWDAMRDQARRATLARLADLGITDLEQHLKFEISYTAEDWQQMYNVAKGSGFGLSHNFWQVGYLRPQNRHTRYRNLYFAGASTHPGTGLPICLALCQADDGTHPERTTAGAATSCVAARQDRNGRRKMNAATLSWEQQAARLGARRPGSSSPARPARGG